MTVQAQPDRWLLLHGTPLTPAVWDGVADRLGDTGEVSRPPVVPPAGIADSQRAIAGRLLAELTGNFHVVGHSFGGQVALDVALLAPGRVRSLTMLCSRDTPFPSFAASAESLRRGDPIDVESSLARWFRPDELAADPPIAAYARSCLVTADRAQWADALAAIATFDRSDSPVQVDGPVILLAAEHDPVSTPEAMAELAERVPGAHLQVLAGAGHMSPFVDPVALGELLLAQVGR